MSMEMKLDEKIRRVSAVIDEALTIQKTNPVFIPVAYFSLKNLGFANSRDVFRLLRESGVITKLEAWWGFEEISKDNIRRFIKTNADDSMSDEDYRVYEIQIDELKFNHESLFSRKQADKSVEFDSLNGTIYYKKIVYSFQRRRKDQSRLKLFRALWEDRKIIENSKVLRKGMPFPAESVAVKIELVESPQDYNRKKEIRETFDQLLKNLERSLRLKKLPIRIYKTGGVQIIIET